MDSKKLFDIITRASYPTERTVQHIRAIKYWLSIRQQNPDDAFAKPIYCGSLDKLILTGLETPTID